MSFDENIIDLDSRKVKERRAHDEVSTGKYRHPNFITSKSLKRKSFNEKCSPFGLTVLHIWCVFSGIKAKESSSNRKLCNSIEVNQESGSISHSSSAVSKSSMSGHTLAAATVKDDSSDQQMTKESSDSMTVYPSGTRASKSASENECHECSISEASIELKQWNYANSDASVQSLKSIASLESQSEDDILQFMRQFVDILFQNNAQLTLELKSEFGIRTRVSVVS